MRPALSRPVSAEVDLGAIRDNVRALAREVSPSALCAVVKADGYGHGALEVARAALGAGATWLAVAVVEEGLELREAGLAAPILVLSDASADGVAAAAGAGLTFTVSSAASADEVAAADPGAHVHVKVDTGMHRVGCQPDELSELVTHVAATGLQLGGIFTHLAVADDPGQTDVTDLQMERFRTALSTVATSGAAVPIVHAANSAGALHHPASRLDLVRCGISLYGYPPSEESGWPKGIGLRPALSLKARVTAVRRVAAEDGVSYGWVRRDGRERRVATVPIGYADGVPRRLGDAGGEALIRGRRCPLAGRVTMDQLMLEVGDDVSTGDEVVLLGTQGDETVTAADWARSTGTISYEILTGITSRIPRRYV
jgi:alanine racemase